MKSQIPFPCAEQLRRSLLVVGCWLFAFSSSAQTATNSLKLTPVVLSSYSEELRTNSPALKAAAARRTAAEARTGGVRSWADPEVSIATSLGSRMRREDDGDLVYGVSQVLPLWGRPAAERRVAEAATRTAGAEWDFRFQQLRLDLVRQFLRTALADRAAAITAEDLTWLDSLVDLTRQRIATGDSSAAAVLRLENERDLQQTKLASEKELAQQARAELNRLLGRTNTAAWPNLELPDLGPEVRFNDRFRQLTIRNEAKLKLLRREAEAAESGIDVAKRATKPDVKVFGELRQYSGSGEAREGMVGVAMSVPWFNRSRYRADIARAEAEADAASFEAADYERFVPVEAQRVATLAGNARREAMVYRDRILPRTTEMLEATRGNWLAGRAELMALFDIRRQRLEAQRMLANATAEQWQMLAEITLCCGLADLEAIEALNDPLPDSGFHNPAVGSKP